MTKEKKVVVLGGGISGLVAAWRLRELNIHVDLCELENVVGGLAGTVRFENGAYNLDFGPHFFVTQKASIVKRFYELVPEENSRYFRRTAQIYYLDRFIDYPLSAKSVLLDFPKFNAILVIASFGWSKLTRLCRKKNIPVHVGEWAEKEFGRHLERIFFRPYTENFWKLPVEELSPDTIPTSTKLNFLNSLKLLFRRRKSNSANSLAERELVLPLRYPKLGFGTIAEAVAEKVVSYGGVIHLAAKATRIETLPNSEYLVTINRGDDEFTLTADYIVSTIPIDNLIQTMSHFVPDHVRKSAGSLGYLSMIVLYIVTPARKLLETSYVYYLGRPYHRLSDMNQFCEDLCPAEENMLAVEFSCHNNDPFWRMTESELLELCLPALEADGILTGKDVRKTFVVKSKQAYPIFYRDYRRHLNNVKKYLEGHPRLFLLGRTGKYRYIDSDHCMEDAISIADKICETLD